MAVRFENAPGAVIDTGQITGLAQERTIRIRDELETILARDFGGDVNAFLADPKIQEVLMEFYEAHPNVRQALGRRPLTRGSHPKFQIVRIPGTEESAGYVENIEGEFAPLTKRGASFRRDPTDAILSLSFGEMWQGMDAMANNGVNIVDELLGQAAARTMDAPISPDQRAASIANRQGLETRLSPDNLARADGRDPRAAVRDAEDAAAAAPIQTQSAIDTAQQIEQSDLPDAVSRREARFDKRAGDRLAQRMGRYAQELGGGTFRDKFFESIETVEGAKADFVDTLKNELGSERVRKLRLSTDRYDKLTDDDMRKLIDAWMWSRAYDVDNVFGTGLFSGYGLAPWADVDTRGTFTDEGIEQAKKGRAFTKKSRGVFE